MNWLLQTLGQVVFWLAYPVAFVYLRIGRRSRVLVLVEDEVLVVKGWVGSNRWQLPGGGVHRNEPLARAACREVKEETGITLSAEQLHLFYSDRAKTYGLHFTYDCYYVQLDKKPALKRQTREISQLAWMPLSELTKKTTSPDTYHAVQTWLKRPNLVQ